MSDQLDRLFADIDAHVEEQEANDLNETPEPGIIAAPTAHGIRRDRNDSEVTEVGREHAVVVGHTRGAQEWREQTPVDLDNIDYELVQRVCARTDTNMRMIDKAWVLAISEADLFRIRRHEGYVQAVRRRLEAIGAESILERKDRWETFPDKVYAGYFACPIARIREILDDMDPRILADRPVYPNAAQRRLILEELEIEFPVGQRVEIFENGWTGAVIECEVGNRGEKYVRVEIDPIYVRSFRSRSYSSHNVRRAQS